MIVHEGHAHMPEFQRLYPPARPAAGAAHWFVFRGDEIVLDAGGSPLLAGDAQQPASLAASRTLLLGTRAGVPLLAGILVGELPEQHTAVHLRTLLATADEETATRAGHAAQLLRWDAAARYCQQCGGGLVAITRDHSWGRECPACGALYYPPISPAIIVLIHDGDRTLLTTKTGWGKRYSLVAGFVEPGETFEACVIREVAEEVGVLVGDVRYTGSQAWPFPHQMMVGFTARYLSGAVVIDTEELAHADWFDRDALPELPPPFAIARRIIDGWLDGSYAVAR